MINSEELMFSKTVVETRKSIFKNGKARTTKSVATTIEYKISDLIMYVEKVDNNKKTIELLTTFKTVEKYHCFVAYDIPKEIIDTVNIFTLSDKQLEQYFKAPQVPIEEIDLNKITLACAGTHEIFDHKGARMPLIKEFDYLHGVHNENYRLKHLHKYLESHPNVLKIGKIEDIPYYNVSKGRDRTFSLRVRIMPEQIEALDQAKCQMYYMFERHAVKQCDVFGVAPFLKEEIEDED